MGKDMRYFTLGLVVTLATSGCASAGGSTDQLRSTVYATHRMVQDLSENLSSTVSRLSDTSAELMARIDASDQETRELMSVAQENQYKLEQLQQSLSSLTATLYRHFNLSPPQTAMLPAPSRPISARPQIDRGGIIVEPPAPQPQPDTGVTTAFPRTVQVPPPAPADVFVPASVDENAHYRQAQQLYGEESYALALQQFEEHLSLFPSSKYSANAAYWKAHCRLKMGDYAEAIASFDAVRTEYPDSGKVPSAMHNQAVAYSRLGQNARAIELFQRLIREYPDDVATEGAREKLRQLQTLN